MMLKRELLKKLKMVTIYLITIFYLLLVFFRLMIPRLSSILLLIIQKELFSMAEQPLDQYLKPY